MLLTLEIVVLYLVIAVPLAMIVGSLLKWSADGDG
jgi:hypothetical protein